jgi:hypothetical protein
MSPFLYDPTPYTGVQLGPIDILYAIIPMVFIIVGIVVILRLFLYREQKAQEITKMNKKKTLKSLIIMKDLEDELEKEMSDAIIARAIRSRPV